MDQVDPFLRLLALTGDLEPGEAGSSRLHLLRRRLAASLREEPEESAAEVSARSPDPRIEPLLRLAIAESVEENREARFVRRESPVSTHLLAVTQPEWALGQTPARTYGPFVDVAGKPVWFDEFLFPKVLEILWAGQQAVSLVIPATAVGPGMRDLEIPAGSIWVAARALTASAPAGAFAGWKIERATLHLSASGSVSGNRLTLTAGAECRLNFVPDRSSVPAPPPGPGGDAAAAEAALPSNAELTLNSSGFVAFRANAARLRAFGISALLERRTAAPTFDAFLQRVFIPLTPAADTIAGASSGSSLCEMSGAGRIERAAWAPTLSKATPKLLSDAGSGGSLVIIATGTFEAKSAGMTGAALRLNQTYVVADREVAGVFAPSAVSRTGCLTLGLWNGSTGRLDWDTPLPFVFVSARAGFDVVQYRGTLTANLDRPVQADGFRLPLRFTNATLVLMENSAGLSTLGRGSLPARLTRTAIALSNGLFTVTPALECTWNAHLASLTKTVSGSLELSFGVFQLLPMLPDPYAANFGPDVRADEASGRLRVKIVWLTPEAPQLDVSVVAGERDDGSAVIIPPPRFTPLSDANAENLRDQYYRFVHDRGVSDDGGPTLRNHRLLDLSTNADQLGVSVSYWPSAPGSIQVRGADLVSLGGPVEVFALPQVQWEPVHIEQNPNVGDLPDSLASPDDGGPALVAARSVRLVPLAPLAVVQAVVDAYNVGREPAGAFFTLPFGIRALATLNPHDRSLVVKPGLELRRQALDAPFTAATQVHLEAVRQLRFRGRAFLPLVVEDAPLLPGSAIQVIQSRDRFNTSIRYDDSPPNAAPSVKPPPFSVLDPLDQDFNRTFGPGGLSPRVPIERVDLSGFGASLFSDWSDENAQIGITQVRFEVLTGRTRYEVVRMRSILWPCEAVVVRTITLERRASGTVFRHDSGWVAVTPGLFELPNSTVRFHPGAVRGYHNIREIRDTPGTIPVGSAEVQAVYFDADIEIDNVVTGAISGGRVPAVRHLGFVQRIPLTYEMALDNNGAPLPGVPGVLKSEVKPLTADELRQLLELKEPVGGSIDCMVNIGRSGQHQRITGVFTSPAVDEGSGQTEFAVACYGSPVLPRNEQWSVVRAAAGTGEVTAVDRHRGVPLVRRGGTASNPPAGAYRWADPQDLLRTPAADYGLQLTTRTNRLLFLRPEIAPNLNRITGSTKPVLADPYALVGSAGPFPKLPQCLHLKVPSYAIEIGSSGFRWQTPPAGLDFELPAVGPAPPQRFLVKSGPFDMRVDYGGIRAFISANQNAPWSVNIPQVPAVLNIKTPPFDDILEIFNDLATPGFDPTALKGPEIRFGGALDEAKKLIRALEGFLADTPPIDIDLSTPKLDSPSLRLRIVARFPIAKPDGSAIDLGIGKFRGHIGVGTEVQLALTSFTGRIFFILGGELQQPLLPKLVYVGGSVELEISIDQSGTPAVRLVTSAVASVGGDLIPGLVELEAAASYGYFLDTKVKPFLPGVAIGLEARAKLLSGFLGVRFRADAAIGVMAIPAGFIGPVPKHDLLLQGTFRAMGSVVAVWALEEDFEKTLRFEQRIDGLAAAAFAVYTGMVPLPV